MDDPEGIGTRRDADDPSAEFQHIGVSDFLSARIDPDQTVLVGGEETERVRADREALHEPIEDDLGGGRQLSRFGFLHQSFRYSGGREEECTAQDQNSGDGPPCGERYRSLSLGEPSSPDRTRLAPPFGSPVVFERFVAGDRYAESEDPWLRALDLAAGLPWSRHL